MAVKSLLAAAGTAAVLARARSGPEDISGEVAIVTGASRGLGLLLARELARQQCPLVICARDQAELDRAAAELRAGGAQVTAVACDVTSPDAPQRLIGVALEQYGRLDIACLLVTSTRHPGRSTSSGTICSGPAASSRSRMACLPVSSSRNRCRWLSGSRAVSAAPGTPSRRCMPHRNGVGRRRALVISAQVGD